MLNKRKKVMNKEIYTISIIRKNSTFGVDRIAGTHVFTTPSVCLASKLGLAKSVQRFLC